MLLYISQICTFEKNVPHHVHEEKNRICLVGLVVLTPVNRLVPVASFSPSRGQ